MTNTIKEIGKVVKRTDVQIWILAPDFESNDNGFTLWDNAEYAETLWGGYEFYINGVIYTVITDRKLYNKSYHCHI